MVRKTNIKTLWWYRQSIVLRVEYEVRRRAVIWMEVIWIGEHFLKEANELRYEWHLDISQTDGDGWCLSRLVSDEGDHFSSRFEVRKARGWGGKGSVG